MRVGQINYVLTQDAARCTFIGRDAAGNLRRPVIELDASDLARLIDIAKSFRNGQRGRARQHQSWADLITDEGVTE